MRSLFFSNNRAKSLYGEVQFMHDDRKSSSAAFEISEAAKIRILLPRLLGAVSVSLRIFNESISEEIKLLPGIWTDSDKEKDIYEIGLDVNDLGIGLYFFILEIDTQFGRIYGYKSGSRLTFSSDFSLYSPYQMSVSNFKYGKNGDKLGGIIYHIFVDRFNKGGDVRLKPGAVTDDDWRTIPEYPLYPGAPLKNNHFFGGTLWGVTAKLDYLKSLGVNTIYLSPIFDAASNHKYDTGDYMTVDSMFGGEEAFLDLISKAKEKGIGIILDGVFNHTGSDSLYFNREGNYDSIGAYQSKKSQY